MINRSEALLDAQKMLFSRLFSIFTNETSRDKPTTKQGTSASTEMPEINLLEAHNNLNTNEKLNQALIGIDKAIQSEGASSQLLLKKADLLLRKQKFNQARQLLNKLSKTKLSGLEGMLLNRVTPPGR